jgi:hypothetical protein
VEPGVFGCELEVLEQRDELGDALRLRWIISQVHEFVGIGCEVIELEAGTVKVASVR